MKDIFSDTYAKTFDIVDSDTIKMYEIHAKLNHVIESQYLGKSREKNEIGLVFTQVCKIYFLQAFPDIGTL